MIYRPVAMKDHLLTSVKEWISHILEIFDRLEFLKELAELIMDYGTLTLCDLLSIILGNRFVLVEPAAVGASYGDFSATWIVLHCDVSWPM